MASILLAPSSNPLYSDMCANLYRRLAYCELYLATAALVLRVFPRMQLYETTVDDVKYDFDLFIPMVKKSSSGVRVTMSP